MDDLPLALAERVVALALDRGVSTALIGANAPDIVELLARNPHTNVDEIRALCTAYHLDGFEPLLVEARQRR